jgi:hypothetical protein
MNDTLEQQAASAGIPMQIAVDDDLRHADCDAHMATLSSIEGTIAIYRGECNMGHHYELRREIAELKENVSIMNGSLAIGEGKGFKAGDLEEM